jgi:hypothetical protein
MVGYQSVEDTLGVFSTAVIPIDLPGSGLICSSTFRPQIEYRHVHTFLSYVSIVEFCLSSASEFRLEELLRSLTMENESHDDITLMTNFLSALENPPRKSYTSRYPKGILKGEQSSTLDPKYTQSGQTVHVLDALAQICVSATSKQAFAVCLAYPSPKNQKAIFTIASNYEIPTETKQYLHKLLEYLKILASDDSVSTGLGQSNQGLPQPNNQPALKCGLNEPKVHNDVLTCDSGLHDEIYDLVFGHSMPKVLHKLHKNKLFYDQFRADSFQSHRPIEDEDLKTFFRLADAIYGAIRDPTRIATLQSTRQSRAPLVYTLHMMGIAAVKLLTKHNDEVEHFLRSMSRIFCAPLFE